MKWLISVLGVLMLAVAAWRPWFLAQGLDGSAVMFGWGGWAIHGPLDGRLSAFPIGLLVCAPAAWLIASSLRGRFGGAVLGAILAATAAVMPFMLRNAIAGSSTGGGPVFVEVDSAPRMVLALAVTTAICSWFSYSRSVLRDPPRN